MNIYISFIVGGMLMMSLIVLQVNMNQNSVETTFTTISSKKVESIGELIDFDFRKIGIGNSGVSFPILAADSNAITFMADLNKDQTAEIVTWRFDNTGSSPINTPNPNDFYIIRTVDSDPDTLNAVVTRFRLAYEMSDGSVISTPSAGLIPEIQSIQLEMICESPAPVNGTRYSKSTWQKIFTPANLQF